LSSPKIEEMTTYIALLRAVNVGGTGKLPMATLKAMCEELGFAQVQTYIASGNVVFKSTLSATKVQSQLEHALADYFGKAVGVHIRTIEQLSTILAANPFTHCAPNRTVVIFLDQAPPVDTLEQISHCKNEELALGKNEIYVHYGDGMADSKLKIPAAKTGTARNINTVTKLLEIASHM
jgi:uncharacterized protein (DUF1697 family)